jgi:hypothetical protein
MCLERGSLQCGSLLLCSLRYASVLSSSGRLEIDTCNTNQYKVTGNRVYMIVSTCSLVEGMYDNDAVDFALAISQAKWSFSARLCHLQR